MSSSGTLLEKSMLVDRALMPMNREKERSLSEKSVYAYLITEDMQWEKVAAKISFSPISGRNNRFLWP